MPSKKHTKKLRFSRLDIKRLLSDLLLYSGNIKKITDVHGPHPHNDYISGVVHTSMDSFNFMASPLWCDDTAWTIHLSNPVETLRQGHRSVIFFSFPKLYKNSELQKRYRIANLVYDAYNNFTNVTEASRLRDYEQILGYERLKTYNRVLAAIIRDYRSFQQDRDKKRQQDYAKN